MADIIATYPVGNKLYRLSGTTWVEFSPQPVAVSEGIWGGPNDTIWLHNRRYGGSVITPKYLFFDGVGSWVEYASPASFPDSGWYVSAIHGSEDGTIVYAGVATQTSSGKIHKFSGGSWADLGVSFRAGSIWCDTTGQYVWAASGDGALDYTLRYSDDYGATWVDKHAQMMADLAIPYFSQNGAPCGVWGTDANNVYIATGWTGFGPPGKGSAGGCIAKWNGSGFEFVSWDASFAAVQWLTTSPWADASRYIAVGGYNYSRIHRDESGTLTVKKDTGYYDSTRGRCVIGIPDGGRIVVIANGIFGNAAESLVSDDDGATWVNVSSVWGSSGEGLQGLTVANYELPAVPTIQLYEPQSGGTIPKQGPLVVDLLHGVANIDLDTLSITATIADGEPDRIVVAEGRLLLEYWEAIITVIDDGYRIYIAPDMFETWRSGQAVSFTIDVKDTIGTPADQKIYAFTATEKPIPLSVYKMLHAGIRRLDDVS